MVPIGDLRIIVFAAIFGCSILGCVLGYEIEFQNQLHVSLQIELRQYHAMGYGGTRDPVLLDKNLVRSDTFLVESMTNIRREYTDTTGGFWISWSAVSPENSNIRCSGEVDLTGVPSPFVVSLDEEACLSSPPEMDSVLSL